MMDDEWFWVRHGDFFSGPFNRNGLDFYVEKKELDNPMIFWEKLPGEGVRYEDIDLRYHIFDFQSTKTYSTDSENDILNWFESGKISKESKVYSHDLDHINGWKINRVLNLGLKITPSIYEMVQNRKGRSLTILCGDNNVGKTYVLKGVQLVFGQSANILLTGRIKPIGQIPEYKEIQSSSKERYFKNFLNAYYNQYSNVDELNSQIEQIFSSLKDEDQDKLIELLEEIIGDRFSIERVDATRRFSPWVIKVNGNPISTASTGTRLSIILLSSLFSQDYEHILIDEPEIGLSPKSQKRLARLLHNVEEREHYFPKLQSIWMATHSHYFLDRENLKNNFIVKKESDKILIESIKSLSEFHHLQFDMLGLDLNSFFLPNGIIIVEGESDLIFVRRLLNVFLPEKKINVVTAYGDGGIPEKLNSISVAFGNIRSNPYRRTLFVLLDRQHNVQIKRLVKLGVLPENIFEWSLNGVEYYYPIDIVKSIFKCELDEYLNALEADDNQVSLNDIVYNKKQLAEEVSSKTTGDSKFGQELISFIERLKDKF